MENNSEKEPRGVLYKCEKCGQPLIERLSNGLWKFKYGRGRKRNPNTNSTQEWNSVFIYIHGSIKMRCFRIKCGHWQVFNYFPKSNRQIDEPAKPLK